MIAGPDQDQHPLDRRRQALDLLVAVGVLGVGGLVGFADRDEGDHRGDQVDQRVDRLGDDRDRAGDRAGGELDRDQDRVGDDRESRRPALGADHGDDRVPAPRCSASSRAAMPAVADLVLLGLAQLRHRPLVLGPGGVRDEGGVVAEAALTPWLLDQPPLAAPFEDMLGAVRFDQREGAGVVGAPAATGRGDLAQELVEVLVVACAGTAVTGRVDSGPAAERDGADPRVVGDRRLPGRGVRGLRLVERDRGEVITVLGRQLDPVRQRLQLDPGQQLAHLAQLVPIAGGEDQRSGYPLLHLAQSRDPHLGEPEQLVEMGAGERRALGRRLHLDQAAVAGHHHVGVDLGAGVLAVVEVAEGPPVDHADADRGDRAVQRHRPRSPSRRAASATPAAARRSRR